MDFTFSEEQQMLLETTRRFIAKDYGFEARRQNPARNRRTGFSPAKSGRDSPTSACWR